jgi:hypothetical protein
MNMPVMHVGRVRVGMHFSFMFMGVSMMDPDFMTVPMMVVVFMVMRMGDPLMFVRMLVRFPEQQDQARYHQREGDQELPTWNAPEYDQ